MPITFDTHSVCDVQYRFLYNGIYLQIGNNEKKCFCQDKN